MIAQRPDAFKSEDAAIILGVGKNMAESIRYWCYALNLTSARSGDSEPTRLADLLFIGDAPPPNNQPLNLNKVQVRLN